MTATPVICFGQQPCGFFPRRFLYAKIETARRLQAEIGGEIVFFCHDSDHDFRETRTTLRHRKTGEPIQLNFAFDNKVQRKFSPLYLKRVRADWHARTAGPAPRLRRPRAGSRRSAPSQATNVADFCLEMYRADGPARRRPRRPLERPGLPPRGVRGGRFLCRCAVRGRDRAGPARPTAGSSCTRAATSTWTSPTSPYTSEQISPTRDTRLRWMQSVIRCTHYVAGASEQDYLRKDDAPEITYVVRDTHRAGR